MLKAAVIGLGVGEQHARYYKNHKGCDLTTLCDLDEMKARAVADAMGVPSVQTSWQEVCTDPDIDVISIASFDHHHADQVLTALKSGKHLFVEKPLCITRSELDAIYALWKGTGLHIVSNLPLRTAPVFQWLKDEISKGSFGEIYAIDAEYLYGRVEKITKGWRKDIEDYSVIEGGGIHMLDLMMYVTGQYPVEVSSLGNKIVTRDTGFRYEDYAVSTFRFQSGMIARLSSNFGCVHPHQHVLKVFGTKATFILDDMGARVQKNRDPLNYDDYQNVPDKHKAKPQAEMLDLPAKPETKAELIDELVCAIHEGDNRGLTLHEFRLMNSCLAAVEALKSGQIEKIGTMYE